MKIFSSIPNFPSETRTIITIGTFDGVHLGHSVILNRLNSLAKKTKIQSLLLTFFPHPRHVLQIADQDMRLINTLDEKKIQSLVEYSERKENIEINLTEQEIKFGNNKLKFEIDEFKKECLLNGLDDIALSLEKSEKISQYENNAKKTKPWIN